MYDVRSITFILIIYAYGVCARFYFVGNKMSFSHKCKIKKIDEDLLRSKKKKRVSSFLTLHNNFHCIMH